MQNDPPDGYIWTRTLVPSGQPKEKQHLHKYDDKANNAYKNFEYDRLQNMRHRIRLLELKPAKSNSDAEIVCRLFEAEFQDGKGGKLVGVGKSKEYTYEALTWCWGTAPSDCLLLIEQQNSTNSKRQKMAVSEELAWALKYLRDEIESRIIWIDAICIDQNSTDEKNHQVQMMAKIYSHAERVVVWLGMDDHNSRKAITFVKDEILQLQRFDELCDDERNSQKWQALLLLMQRPWFFRRWVVQEISLAKDAIIHCGPDQIPWNDFCVAVELFVEVETATHRLSEVMKKDPKFFHLPGWFDYVSALGASLLVEATTMIFRQYQPESLRKRQAQGRRRQETFKISTSTRRIIDQSLGGDPDDIDWAPDFSEVSYGSGRGNIPSRRIPPPPRGDSSRTGTQLARSLMASRSPLLSLEYLVSKLSIFETTEPRDAIYAFLAIAKDTIPKALSQGSKGTGQLTPEERKQASLAMFDSREQKLFNVDYARPYAEVCQHFMEFCIRNSTLTGARSHALDILCRPWAPSPARGISDDKTRKVLLHPVISDDYLVAMKRPFQAKANSVLKSKIETPPKIPLEMSGKHKGALRAFREKYPATLKRMSGLSEDMIFPTWIPRLEGAPFVMSPTPGTNIKKMSRQNANPLVGLPGNQHTYDAGQGIPVSLSSLKFNRLYLQGAHCMHIRGFELSSVLSTSPTSQGGQIPKQWLELANWENAGDAQKDDGPPEEFWRTLVADRGVNARNPPSFYARACKESAAKGGLAGGTINTSDLIYNEQNSIVVQFCRRVQEVIWNKKLIVTQDGQLGLASEAVTEDDIICILYGASVPVILRKIPKTTREMIQEEDEVDLFRKLDKMTNRLRKAVIKRRQKKAWAELPEVGILKKGSKPAIWGKKEVREALTEWRKLQGLPEKPLPKVAPKVPEKPAAKFPKTFPGDFPEKIKLPTGKENVNLEKESIREESSTDDPSPGTSELNGDPTSKNDNDSKEEITDYYFEFMGECYIHGMMDGEAMKWKSETREGQQVEDEIFELR